MAEAGVGAVGVAGALVGRYYEKDGRYAQLVVLSISERVRGSGVGQMLVEAIEDWSAGRGAREGKETIRFPPRRQRGAVREAVSPGRLRERPLNRRHSRMDAALK